MTAGSGDGLNLPVVHKREYFGIKLGAVLPASAVLLCIFLFFQPNDILKELFNARFFSK